MSNLTQRTLSGIGYVTVFTLCILLGKISFCLLFTIVTALAIEEFNNILEDHNLADINRTVSTISGVLLFLAFYLFSSGQASLVIFMPWTLSVVFILVSELYLVKPHPLANIAYTFAGQVYIAFPFALFNLLAFRPETGYSAILPLSVFVFLWLNDSGAYVFGSLLHTKIPYRLFPRVSPHKSWIGSIGGGVVVLLAACCAYLITNTEYHILSLPAWLGLGLIIVVFGTWGDLVESLFKRQLGMKDSGRFLPGHGGVLDRFDSALLAIPATVIYLYSLDLIV